MYHGSRAVLAFLIGFVFVFAFILSCYAGDKAGKIIEPIDLMCYNGHPNDLLFKTDKDYCSSGYVIFINDEGEIYGYCLDKEMYNEYIEVFNFLHEFRIDCLKNPSPHNLMCPTKENDPCKGYKKNNI